jgi:hypothetical protein
LVPSEEEIMRIPRLIVLSFKGLLILLASVLVFALGYIVHNWPVGTKYKIIPEKTLRSYIASIESMDSDPANFVSERFAHHDIVLIGEAHKRKQDVDFVRSLIPALYRKNHVTVLGWEFGASALQSEVDSLLSAEKYDERWATSILRRSNFFWNYQEYRDFFRDIWEFNHSLPKDAERVRFLQLGSMYNERLLQSPDRDIRQKERDAFSYDKKMFEIMEREALQKGKKALWYSGLHHAFTRFREPLPFFLEHFRQRRGGNFLYAKYPTRIYLIALHAPVPERFGLLLGPFGRTYYPWEAVCDKVYDRRHAPYAFDVATSPLGACEDNYSYYSLDHHGPIQLKDFCDGYVVLNAFRETQPVHTITNWIADAGDSAEVFSKLSPDGLGKLGNVAALLHLFEEDPMKMMRYLNAVDTTGYAQ